MSIAMDPNPAEAIHHERPIRIVCIGAGASGLCLAYKLQRSFREFILIASHSIQHYKQTKSLL